MKSEKRTGRPCRNMRRNAAVLLICLLSVFMAGCGAGTDTAVRENSAPEKDKLQIGVSFDSMVQERWLKDRDIFVSTARALGAEVNVQNAFGDVDEQIRQIDYFLGKKMDAIVVIPVETDALSEAAARARAAGVPVISYDRMMLNTDYSLYISVNSESVGRLMAQAIEKAMPDGGKILKITGPMKDYNVTLLDKGFDQEISGKGFEIVDEYYAKEWKTEEAFEYLSTHETYMSGVKAIMCGNDSLAGGVVQYLSERRIAGQVTVVGQDADLEACQRIVEGTQAMTAYKPIEELASKAAECAVALAKGENIQGTGHMSGDEYGIPYRNIEPVAVDRENIDEVVIGSGFHLREEVYLNVND